MSLSDDQKKALAAKRETLTLRSEIAWPVDRLKALFEETRSGELFGLDLTLASALVDEQIAALNYDEFIALGKRVTTTAKKFRGDRMAPVEIVFDLKLSELEKKHGVEEVKADRDQFWDLCKQLERIGTSLTNQYDVGPRGTPEQLKVQFKLLEDSMFSTYAKITKIPNKHKGSLQRSWVECVDVAAKALLELIGHGETLKHFLNRLKTDFEKRRLASLSPEQLAIEMDKKKEKEEQRKAEMAAASAAFDQMIAEEPEDYFDESFYYEDPVASQFEVDEYKMEIAMLQEDVWLRDLMVEQVAEILDSKGTLEEKFAKAQPLVAFAQSHYKFSKDTVAGVERHLLKPKKNGKPKDEDWKMGVKFLNNIKNPVDHPLTLHFRPQEEDGNDYQGHSRQMLALRTGIAVELWTTKTIDIVILDRMSNKGNAVIAEIKHEGQSATAIVAVVIDAEGKPCIGTAMHLHDELWEKIEQKAITDKQRYSNLPPAWFAKKHFEIQAAFDKNEKKASG